MFLVYLEGLGISNNPNTLLFPRIEGQNQLGSKIIVIWYDLQGNDLFMISDVNVGLGRPQSSSISTVNPEPKNQVACVSVKMLSSTEASPCTGWNIGGLY